MQFAMFISSTVAIAGLAAAQASGPPGYLTGYSTVNDTNLCFGKNYAVLNLDLINGIVAGVNSTAEGQAWINSTATWIDAVHKKSPRPLDIFTRIYFSNAYRPELGDLSVPFAKAAGRFGNITESTPTGQIYPAFQHDDTDVILQKTRYYAGFGNPLIEILSSNKIDTVVLSGIRSSGVILSTAYALFDQNYKVYVIGDNVIESPGMNAPATDAAIKTGIISKFPADVITLKQALAALDKSG